METQTGLTSTCAEEETKRGDSDAKSSKTNIGKQRPGLVSSGLLSRLLTQAS